MARSENEVDQIVFRWDSENVSGSTGFGPVAWSAPHEEVETLFGIFGALLRASGEETRPALLRLHQRAGVLLIRRTPWTDPGGRSSVICHALVGSAELLDPATCLGLHGWNWEGAALPLAEVRGPLPVVPARALERASGPIALQEVESELVGTTAELLRNPKARFTLLDERGDTACPVLWGLHGMFGGLLPDRRWTFASHDTVELPALRFVFVGKWAGAASRNTDRRRVDPRERLGDRAEEIATRLVHHHLWSLSEADARKTASVADALRAVPGSEDRPLLETAERALAALDDMRTRRAGETRRERSQGAGEARRGDSRARATWPRDAHDDGDAGARAPGGVPEGRGVPRSEEAWPGDTEAGGGPNRAAGAAQAPGISHPHEGWPPGDASGGDRGARGAGAVRDTQASHEDQESRGRREEPGPGAPHADRLPYGGERQAYGPQAYVPQEVREARAAHDPGGRKDAPLPPAPRAPAPAHDPVDVPVVAPVWRGPEGGGQRRLLRPRGRGKAVETGLVRRLATSAEDAEAHVRAGGDGELLDALRRPQPYAVTTLLMGEVARRLPSWEHSLRREFRDLVIGQELFATTPRSTQPGEPGEAERAANAAALHRWAVRPLLDEGDVPAGALVALLSGLRSSPVPAARSAFRQIVDDERPGLPEDIWRALLREAYAQPQPQPRAMRPAFVPAPAPAPTPVSPSPPPPRPAAPPPPSRRPEPPPAVSSGGDGKLVALALVAVLVILISVIVAIYAT
ncbi:hypothetical protein ACFC0D_05720 [Streptomyces sp. NPDC056222]|uniref:hypothetical protein n=1 Tax=Streptomyces sp. NPDC056222 TaxID=3345749 RepID=UPI0035DB7D3A